MYYYISIVAEVKVFTALQVLLCKLKAAMKLFEVTWCNVLSISC